MALVHEKLYQSEDMISVDFSDYIQNLANYLFGAYSVGDKNISLKLDVDNIFLGMDTSVPLGIIINELVSNALKHAFQKKESGEICVCLKKEEQGSSEKNCFSLVVRDNGRGFPKEIDFRETDSLGLQLVINLVDQIEGSIELNTHEGTEFRIRFKELRYRQRM